MEQLRVGAAAIVASNGTLYSLKPPARHDTIFRFMQARGENCRGTTQGFLLSDGTFATRGRAAVVAFEAGQLPKDTVAPFTLMSEDLW
jgi:hypothetical protein